MVLECLDYAETITGGEVNQCLVYPLLRVYEYQKYIILMGTLQLAFAFMKMLGIKMESSGLSGVFLEGGLLGTGTIQSIAGL